MKKKSKPFVVSDYLENEEDLAAYIEESRGQIALSERDWDAFMKALDNPSKPNAKLRAAAKKYREIFGKKG